MWLIRSKKGSISVLLNVNFDTPKKPTSQDQKHSFYKCEFVFLKWRVFIRQNHKSCLHNLEAQLVWIYFRESCHFFRSSWSWSSCGVRFQWRKAQQGFITLNVNSDDGHITEVNSRNHLKRNYISSRTFSIFKNKWWQIQYTPEQMKHADMLWRLKETLKCECLEVWRSGFSSQRPCFSFQHLLLSSLVLLLSLGSTHQGLLSLQSAERSAAERVTRTSCHLNDDKLAASLPPNQVQTCFQMETDELRRNSPLPGGSLMIHRMFSWEKDQT